MEEGRAVSISREKVDGVVVQLAQDGDGEVSEVAEEEIAGLGEIEDVGGGGLIVSGEGGEFEGDEGLGEDVVDSLYL